MPKDKNIGGRQEGSFFDKANKLLFGKAKGAAKTKGAKGAEALINMHKKKK